ncbi:lipopolysaccharide biosynthesis protein [Marinobacter profundi]|uniref:Lipopolysaccharide biosynthesis protein n=1 Tax=Marinobacter profundi TaxID=2666256 RepID=A0A2G1UGD2_9GAMM|nr:lipopolysaccharide biosynthesis protein [Marinobacter profundi]PHQ13522.1 lipopolysaccharide biosynthesis protein [Marinobacter profundi]
MKGINRKIGVGVLWNLVSLFLSRGATTVFTLFLARLLAPEAFGLVAMATVVFELASAFVNSGLGQALIRSKSVSDTDLTTVFYTNLVLSGCAYGVLFFGAPYVAGFYKQPELTSLVQVMGLVVFINATRVVQTAVLSREMNFKSQMKANSIAALGSGILAVSAAYLGWGVWSLVVMMLSQAFITSAIMWLASNWRPTLTFSFESFFRLFKFGRNLLAEGILEISFQNSYVLVIGRFFSAEVTGLYFFAKKVTNLISQHFTGAVQQATFPALSTLQDDNEMLRHKYRQVLQLMMFLVAPIMALLAGLASPLFGLLFDARWQGAVPYLQLLCVVGALFPLHSLNVSLLNVKGRSDLVLKVGLLKKAVNLALLFGAIPFGVIGIVVSQVIGSALALVPNTYYSARLIGYPLGAQLRDVLKPVLASCIAGWVAWSIAGKMVDASVGLFVAASGIGVAAYLLLSVLIRAEGAALLLRKGRSWLDKKFAGIPSA